MFLPQGLGTCSLQTPARVTPYTKLCRGTHSGNPVLSALMRTIRACVSLNYRLDAEGTLDPGREGSGGGVPFAEPETQTYSLGCWPDSGPHLAFSPSCKMAPAVAC